MNEESDQQQKMNQRINQLYQLYDLLISSLINALSGPQVKPADMRVALDLLRSAKIPLKAEDRSSVISSLRTLEYPFEVDSKTDEVLGLPFDSHG